ANIHFIWQIVAEDYSPFNINVTTVAPAADAQHVSQIDIGGDSWISGAGGVAQVGGVTYGTGSSPARGFVFSNVTGDIWWIAAATAHESGHTMGLWHQSYWSGTTLVYEYQPGPGDGTGPIMGGGSSASRAMWWYGTSNLGSTFYQDDMQVISGAV